eukprot:m.88084 g.88084  ORF g.88084 m.88084 type:complete len:161 (-) comp13609_c0_seq1:183-665(-)
MLPHPRPHPHPHRCHPHHPHHYHPLRPSPSRRRRGPAPQPPERPPRQSADRLECVLARGCAWLGWACEHLCPLPQQQQQQQPTGFPMPLAMPTANVSGLASFLSAAPATNPATLWGSAAMTTNPWAAATLAAATSEPIDAADDKFYQNLMDGDEGGMRQF